MSKTLIAPAAAMILALACASQTLAAQATVNGGTVIVKSQTKPDKPWKEYPTHTVDLLAGFKPGAKAVPVSIYGGRTDKKEKATGFFHVAKVADRWWLVDPEGNLFIHVGIASVSVGKSSKNVRSALAEKFGGAAGWGEATTQMLWNYGFNGTGAWSSAEPLRAAKHPVAYTLIWNFMSGFGKSKNMTFQKPGHAGYTGDVIPVFHPDFPAYCERAAQALAATKDDPWLIGHFSDNEMPGEKNLLDKYLKLDAADPNLAPSRKAAEAWVVKRRGSLVAAKDLTDEDRDEWRGHVFGTYFEITAKAIRKVDPNHLCLGSRLHGQEKTSPATFREAGKHLDAIAVNYYGAWTPDPTTLANWTAWSGRPVMITEWYTKGADVPGLINSTGAGWIVPTQRDRGLFYQNYTLGLLASKTCVGWHWFKYMDNDPEDLSTDPSNRDSNKGIVNIKYEPYAPLMDLMKQLNQNVYALTDYFDK